MPVPDIMQVKTFLLLLLLALGHQNVEPVRRFHTSMLTGKEQLKSKGQVGWALIRIHSLKAEFLWSA